MSIDDIVRIRDEAARTVWTPTLPSAFAGPTIFLDQVDADGEHIGYVGCAPDRRAAERMRAREAFERGCPENRIVFTKGN